METEGHTLRELHAGDRLRREVVGVEDLQLAAIRRVVVDETHQPAVVLTRPAGRGDEHELAGRAPGSEVVDFRGAGVEVVLEVRGGVERVGRVGPHRVPVAVLRREQRLVHARELLTALVDEFVADLARREIDRPAVQRRRTAAVRTVDELALGREHRRVPGHVDDDGAVVRVVGVHRVEHVARVDLGPLHVRVATVTRHHTDARRRIGVPTERERLHGEVEHHRQIEEQDATARDREVVHHHRPRQRDRFAAHELTARVDQVVDEVRLGEPVRERVQLARDRVDLRVGGEPTRQRSAEVDAPQRVELA